MTTEPSTTEELLPPEAGESEEVRLQDLVDVAILQHMQDWFASTTGISVSVRDPHGNYITQPSSRNSFCALVNGQAVGGERCRASNVRAMRRAAEHGKPTRYVCHAGLAQFAAPIMVAGRCVATLVLGDRPLRQLSPARLLRLSRELGVPMAKLQEAARELVLWSDDTMAKSAEFLYGMARAITDICYQGYLLRKRLRELGSLYATAQLLTSTMDLDEMLRLIAQQVTVVLGVRGCSIRLLASHGRELQIQSYYNLSRRYIDKGPVLVGRSVIDQQALNGEVVEVRDMSSDPRILYPREAEREGLRSGVTVGLMVKGKAIGTLHLYSGEQRTFTRDEIRLLQAVANQAAVGIENARLYKDSLAKQAIDRELAIAGEIQEELLPDNPPDLKRFDIEGVSLPSKHVGGDFYDFIPVDENHLAVVIADVAGKGIPGALLMATSRAALRAQAERELRPNRVLKRLGKVLLRDTALEHFVTVFYGILDLTTGVLRYANAGHNPPFRLRRGRAAFLRQAGLVLGVSATSEYENGRAALLPGDVLVLFTDGVTEARNPKRHMFQERRLVDIVRRHQDGTAAQIIAAVRHELDTFTAGAPRADDQTLVVIRAR